MHKLIKLGAIAAFTASLGATQVMAKAHDQGQTATPGDNVGTQTVGPAQTLGGSQGQGKGPVNGNGGKSGNAGNAGKKN